MAAKPSERTTFNLARVLAELDRVAEASVLLRGIVLDPSADLLIRDAAEALLARVAPRVATLRIHVAGALSQRVVLLDERPVEALRAGVGIPVDPGRHVITVSDASGTPVARSVVSIAPGAETSARLTIIERTPAGDPAAAPALETDDAPITSRWWFWTGAGAAVAAAAVVVGILAATSGPSPTEGNVEAVFVGGSR